MDYSLTGGNPTSLLSTPQFWGSFDANPVGNSSPMPKTFLGMNQSQMANFGLGLSAYGAASSAVGAYYSAESQQTALNSSAAVDLINARSVYNAATTSSSIDVINAKAANSYQLMQAQMMPIEAKSQAINANGEAAIGMIRAQGSAAQLEAGAEIDDNQGKLAGIQAEYALIQGNTKESEVYQQAEQQKAHQTARMAAGNVDLGAGTSAVVRAGYDLQAQNAVMQINTQALMAALADRTQQVNAQISAAGKRAAAAATLSAASMQVGLTKANSDFNIAMANSKAQFITSMANIGLANAESAAQVKDLMAQANLITGTAAANAKQTMANAISPGMAGFASLLSGAGSVAGAYFNWTKIGG